MRNGARNASLALCLRRSTSPPKPQSTPSVAQGGAVVGGERRIDPLSFRRGATAPEGGAGGYGNVAREGVSP